MGRALILETTFLIDLEREARRRRQTAAHDVLAQHAADRLYITPTIAGELAAGASLAERGRWETYVAPFHVLALNRDVCWEYGNAFRYLQANGLLIGSNDLWIAAAAIAYGMPVVTRNAKEYARVPRLEVIGY